LVILNQNAILEANIKAIRDLVFQSTKLYADLAFSDYLVPTPTGCYPMHGIDEVFMAALGLKMTCG